jgi:hypothetical protein
MTWPRRRLVCRPHAHYTLILLGIYDIAPMNAMKGTSLRSGDLRSRRGLLASGVWSTRSRGTSGSTRRCDREILTGLRCELLIAMQFAGAVTGHPPAFAVPCQRRRSQCRQDHRVRAVDLDASDPGNRRQVAHLLVDLSSDAERHREVKFDEAVRLQLPSEDWWRGKS